MPFANISPNSILIPMGFDGPGAAAVYLSLTGPGGNLVWPMANLAVYVPFRVTTPVIATKLFRINGNVVGTDSFDIGIYSLDGTKLVSSGATVTAGASAPQMVDITDTPLGPGIFYLAMSQNGTPTDNVYRHTLTNLAYGQALGMLQQTSAYTLPATATFAQNAQTFVPFMGILLKAISV